MGGTLDHRALELGFASGRFPFSNTPYGIVPRDEVERSAWPALRGKIFMEATEILLRFLRGDVFSSGEVGATVLRRSDFRSDEDFAKVAQAWQRVTGESAGAEIPIRPRWTFDKVGVIPFEAPLENLRLTIGAHWAEAQRFANEFLPVGVFNLSITPAQEIEDTHRRMLKYFNSQGGAWTRDRMPRTVLVFVNDDAVSLEEKRRRAQEAATMATTNYWRAIEGTLDPGKVTKAVDNALVGAPEDLIEQIHQRFHPEDRMMLWFDFNNHDSEAVQNSMRIFMEKIAPKLKDSSR